MIGDEIKRERLRRGITQEKLADEAGVHRTYISLLERNLKNPTIDVLLRICAALRTPASVLLKRLEKKP